MQNVIIITSLAFAVVIGVIAMPILLIGYAPHPIYNGEYISGVAQISNIEAKVSYKNAMNLCYSEIKYIIIDDIYIYVRYIYLYKYDSGSNITCSLTKLGGSISQIGDTHKVLYRANDIIFDSDMHYIKPAFISGMILISFTTVGFIICGVMLLYRMVPVEKIEYPMA